LIYNAGGVDMTEKTEDKRSVGRPTKYDESMCGKIYKLALLGATDTVMASILGVSESTLNLWKIEHPEFSESIRKGKDEADSEVAVSLYKRATGYVGKKVVTAAFQGKIGDVQEVDEYVAPDVSAAIFWLKNRQGNTWRDKQQTEISGPEGAPIKFATDPIEASKVYQDLMVGKS
jgi:hypothetical protein